LQTTGSGHKKKLEVRSAFGKPFKAARKYEKRWRPQADENPKPFTMGNIGLFCNIPDNN